MFPRKLIALSFIAVLALFAGITQNVDPSRAQGSQLAPNSPLGTSFTYQGVLKDASGNPITASCDFRFLLYDAEVGGAQVGPIQDLTTISVANSYFTVTLDFGSTAFTGEARWLEVAVKCSGEANYTILVPRQALTASPYASYAPAAGNTDLLDGQQASFFLDATHVNTGTLGTAYFSAYSDLSDEGYLDLGAAGDLVTRSQGDGRYSRTTHNHWGWTMTGTGTGLNLTSDTTGIQGNGDVYGIYGYSDTTDGKGVYGYNYSTTGSAFGVFGRTESETGMGVHGLHKATTGKGYGTSGLTMSSEGYGVRGFADNTSGENVGVFGKSISSEGYGIVGSGENGAVGVGAWSESGNLIEAYDSFFSGGIIRFYIDQSGNVYAAGTYNEFKTSSLDGEAHALTSMQTTEAWLEDFGRLSLVDGKAVVTIASDFAGVADLSEEYHVFLTPQGDSMGLYVTNLTPTSFEVHEQNGGKSNIAFSYRIVARPAGSETVRLPEVALPEPVEVPRQPSDNGAPVEQPQQPQPAAPVLPADQVQP